MKELYIKDGYLRFNFDQSFWSCSWSRSWPNPSGIALNHPKKSPLKILFKSWESIHISTALKSFYLFKQPAQKVCLNRVAKNRRKDHDRIDPQNTGTHASMNFFYAKITVVSRSRRDNRAKPRRSAESSCSRIPQTDRFYAPPQKGGCGPDTPTLSQNRYCIVRLYFCERPGSLQPRPIRSEITLESSFGFIILDPAWSQWWADYSDFQEYFPRNLRLWI